MMRRSWAWVLDFLSFACDMGATGEEDIVHSHILPQLHTFTVHLSSRLLSPSTKPKAPRSPHTLKHSNNSKQCYCA
ncbi:atypical rio rio1 protein kinase [Moniliophthora roreri]|nr:atypical rio rio1 protein kinase [Moniliophthora roreri]